MGKTTSAPAYPGYFADPFIWKHDGIWYAVGTGALEASSQAGTASEALTQAGTPGVFLQLRSEDFRTWAPLGTALELLSPEFGHTYWAPEVTWAEGKFWMYYSVGWEDRNHHIRVAVSEYPQGPFRDTGSRITHPFLNPFAIDGSPFMDDDGSWYLFYARDFLDADEKDRAGTALVVDRLSGMTRLAGEERVVARPQLEWQRFLADRVMYGGRYDWHTLEGPCVRKRLGRYWCLFSGGRWENETYGVDWAVADHPLGPWNYAGTGSGARVLRTRPGEMIGPGHNSITEGPDGRDYIVYHAWDPAMTARRMFINVIEWTENGPWVDVE